MMKREFKSDHPLRIARINGREATFEDVQAVDWEIGERIRAEMDHTGISGASLVGKIPGKGVDVLNAANDVNRLVREPHNMNVAQLEAFKAALGRSTAWFRCEIPTDEELLEEYRTLDDDKQVSVWNLIRAMRSLQTDEELDRYLWAERSESLK